MIYEETFDHMAEEFDGLEKQKLAISQRIKENYDPRTKTVGDRILVWDMSRLTELETDNYIKDEKIYNILEKYHSVVIEDNCKYDGVFKTLMGDFSINLDLKIWNKHLNKVYRTSSEFVKLV